MSFPVGWSTFLTWRYPNNGIRHRPPSTSDLKGARDLVFDPLHPGVVFLTTDGGAYRSQDNGITWERIASGYADM